MDQDVFNTDRPLLFSIAYRMLGSASDAEGYIGEWLPEPVLTSELEGPDTVRDVSFTVVV